VSFNNKREFKTSISLKEIKAFPYLSIYYKILLNY
jgi:hypothetical protein